LSQLDRKQKEKAKIAMAREMLIGLEVVRINGHVEVALDQYF